MTTYQDFWGREHDSTVEPTQPAPGVALADSIRNWRDTSPRAERARRAAIRHHRKMKRIRELQLLSAEVLHLAGSDHPDRIAQRVGWGKRESLVVHLRRNGHHEAADSLEVPRYPLGSVPQGRVWA